MLRIEKNITNGRETWTLFSGDCEIVTLEYMADAEVRALLVDLIARHQGWE